MDGTVFEDNIAYEGPALYSYGSISSMSGTWFNSNSLYCQADNFGYDIDADEVRPSEPKGIRAIFEVME